MENVKDERFSHISTDPKFKAAPKSVRKVKIDKRFQSLFTDKRFQVNYTVDKRGKQVDQTSNENFRKYYDLSSEEESDSGSDTNKKEPTVIEKLESGKTLHTTPSPKLDSTTNISVINDSPSHKAKSKDLQIDDSDNIEKVRLTDEIKKKLRDPNIDYARGVGTLVSDSSSEEESSESKYDWPNLN